VRVIKGVPLAVFLKLVARAAGADPLQFRIAVGGQTSYASFAQIRLLNAENRPIFEGYTDRYGRVNVPIAPGRYRAVVITSGQTRTKVIDLTGAKGLRLVTLE